MFRLVTHFAKSSLGHFHLITNLFQVMVSICYLIKNLCQVTHRSLRPHHKLMLSNGSHLCQVTPWWLPLHHKPGPSNGSHVWQVILGLMCHIVTTYTKSHLGSDMCYLISCYPLSIIFNLITNLCQVTSHKHVPSHPLVTNTSSQTNQTYA